MKYPSGWTCERVVLKLELYLLMKLPQGEALAVAEHVEACADCAELLALLGPPLQGGRRG